MLREKNGIIEPISLLIDLFLIGIGFYLIIKLAINSDYIPLKYFLIFLSYILFWTLNSNVMRVYESRRFMSFEQELLKIFKSHFLSFILTISFLILFDPKFIGDRFIFYFVAIALGLTFSVHILIRLILQYGRRSGYNTKYSLILGSGIAAKTYLEKVKNNPQLGYKIIGYLAPQRNGLEIPYLGTYSQLESVMNLHIVDTTVVTASVTEEGIEENLALLDMMGKNVVIMVDDMVAKVASSRSLDFGGLSMVAFDSHPRNPWQEMGKQFFDFGVTLVILLLISPLMLAITLAIKISSNGPVIFSQERVGLNGRIFKMYKFRSMVVNAEALKAELADQNEMSGPVFKIKNDPRVTTVGKFLRKTSLDELPQLWNVLKQDMSLVGPRPPLPSEVNMYDPKHRKRLAVRPGITCIWQISGRNHVDFNQWMDMDAEYVDRWTFWLDMVILAKTVPVVLMRKGAC
ncbi:MULTISPECIES: sugar transferase [unclassified Dehalobacter]|uniref:sugar transferase n=1 Tax=unclassified Dehalobacter TaxID=2635733 RepID=UPI000360E745|nr:MULTISPECIES: sugar transferase [unclassified Dehalobacter]RJE48981.1 polyprenyl glycosylphosphotransferase [Dehalobacter sp. MCB1]TCX51719.1 sugar transferase [Dehalobacter sp. 14DCB1]TCX52779.1 sugar transferase [Dehalobacter sp. 12DCB1]